MSFNKGCTCRNVSSSVVAEAMPRGECGFGRFLSQSRATGTVATFPDLWSPSSCGIKTWFTPLLLVSWWFMNCSAKEDGKLASIYYWSVWVRENMNDARKNMTNQAIGLRRTNARWWMCAVVTFQGKGMAVEHCKGVLRMKEENMWRFRLFMHCSNFFYCR